MPSKPGADIVVVMDPIGSIKIAKDSTFAMLLEGQRRGHRLWYVRPGGLAVVDGQAQATVAPLTVKDDPADWYGLGDWTRLVFGPGQIVLMRKDPPVDADLPQRHPNPRPGPARRRARSSTTRRACAT